MNFELDNFHLRNSHTNSIVKVILLISMHLLFFIQFIGCYSSKQTNTSFTKITSPENVSAQKSNEDSTETVKIFNSELDKNRRLWIEHKIVNYNITVTGTQGGNVIPPENILIEVRDGKGSILEKETLNYHPARLQLYEEFNTIDKMFDEIQRGIDNGADIEVQYNKKFGYPKKWFVNYLKKGTDQGKGITINKFEIIPKN